VERLLVKTEEAPWNWLYRIAIGFLIVPMAVHFGGASGASWVVVPTFISVLFLLRVLPLLFRMALPFSSGVKVVWASRRRLAKRYDSYQWRKLLWFGLGLAGQVLASAEFRVYPVSLAILCLISGGLGEFFWRAAAASE
jgi:hypothetical protein